MAIAVAAARRFGTTHPRAGKKARGWGTEEPLLNVLSLSFLVTAMDASRSPAGYWIEHLGEKLPAYPFHRMLPGAEDHQSAQPMETGAARGIFMMEYIDLVVFDGGRFW